MNSSDGSLEHRTTNSLLHAAGTPIHDALLGSVALLPLRHLSLADTGVGQEGVGQLLAITSLTHLDLRNSQAGDGVFGVLAQLPLLAWLDLSGTEFTGGGLDDSFWAGARWTTAQGGECGGA
jgi:hypothetical protein